MTDKQTPEGKEAMAKLSGIEVNRADARRLAAGVAAATLQKIRMAIRDVLFEAPNNSLPAPILLQCIFTRFQFRPSDVKPQLDWCIQRGFLSYDRETEVITYVRGL